MGSLYGSIINHSPRSLFDISRVVSTASSLQGSFGEDDGVPLYGYALVYYGEEGEGLYSENLARDNQKWEAAEGHLINFNKTVWQKRPKYAFQSGTIIEMSQYFAVARLDSVLPYLNSTQLKGYENKVVYQRLNAIPLEIMQDIDYQDLGYENISKESASGMIAFDEEQMDIFNTTYPAVELNKSYINLYEATKDISNIEDNKYILIDYSIKKDINTYNLGEDFIMIPVGQYNFGLYQYFLEEPISDNNLQNIVLSEEDIEEGIIEKYKLHNLWWAEIDENTYQPINWPPQLRENVVISGYAYEPNKFYIFDKNTETYKIDERQDFDLSSVYYIKPKVYDYEMIYDFYDHENSIDYLIKENQQIDQLHFGNNDSELNINYHLTIFKKVTDYNENGEVINQYLTPVSNNRLKMQNESTELVTSSISEDSLEKVNLDNYRADQFSEIYDNLIANSRETTAIKNFSDLDSLAFQREIEKNISRADANIIIARENLIATQEKIKADTDILLVNQQNILNLSNDIDNQNEIIQTNINAITTNQEDRIKILENIENSNKKITDNSDIITTNTTEVTKTLNNLQSAINNLNNFTTGIEDSIQTEIKLIEDNNNTINEAIIEIKNIISNSIPAQLRSINSNKETLLEEIESISNSLKDYSSLLSQANTNISTAVTNGNNSINILTSTIQNINTNLSTINSSVSTIKGLNTTATNYATLLSNECTKITTAKNNINSEITNLNTINTNLNNIKNLKTILDPKYTYSSEIPTALENISNKIQEFLNTISNLITGKINPSISIIQTSAKTTIPNLLENITSQIGLIQTYHNNLKTYNEKIIESNNIIFTESNNIAIQKDNLNTLYINLNNYKIVIQNSKNLIADYNTNIQEIENENMNITRDIQIYLQININQTEFLNAMTDEYALYVQMLEWYRWEFLPAIIKLNTNDIYPALYTYNTRTLEYPTK